MAKRKTPPPATTTSTTTKITSGVKNLQLYQKSYKGGGIKDTHFEVFHQVQSFTKAKTVLYPGCHRHLTTSLIFPCVTYVDCDSKVKDLYSETAAREFVETHKIYNDDNCQYEFICDDVCHPTATTVNELKKQQYDLLISLSAGLLAESCTPYTRRDKNGNDDCGGWLLINDSHCDARSIYVNSLEAGSCEGSSWQLKAYWDDTQRKFVTDDLQRCFRSIDKKTKQEAVLSKEQVAESINVGSISKRSFIVPFAPMFYLFQLQNNKNQQDG